ncbi:MAG: hypothetical protein ACJASX_001124 [Limisphaerales bacterium]|jgi:hypothetical protein
MHFVRTLMLLLCLGLPALAQDQLTLMETNGTEHVGKLFSVKSGTIMLRKPSGSLGKRIPLAKLDQKTLKMLEKLPKAKRYVEFLINRPKPKGGGPADSLPTPKKGKLDPPTFTEVENKPEIPEVGGLLGALFGTGPGWFLILVIYGANIFAGYAVGMYRRWNKYMVPGISAAVPIITPIVFMCMKPRKVEKKETVLGKGGADDDGKPAKKKGVAVAAKPQAKKVVTARPAAAAAKKVAGRQVAPAAPAKLAAPPMKGGPIAVAAPVAPAPAAAAPAAAAGPATIEAASYTRGEVNINKRFIESTFAPFFKLVPDEPFRSAWMCFITTRGEFWAKRIPKISQTDVTIQCPQEGGGSKDHVAQIADIQEIHVRPPEE